MPFDGNGNFTLLYDWTADRDAGYPTNRILAQRMDDQFQDIADGLEALTAEAVGQFVATSTSSVAVGTGSKAFTIQAGKAFRVGQWVTVASTSTPQNYMHGQVASYSGTTLTVTVLTTGGSGTIATWTVTVSSPRGPAVALTWNFDSNTTTAADPGTGDVRLNHATLASVTELSISDLCGETGNPDVAAWVATWDDSTSTVNGFLTIRKKGAEQNYAIFAVGALTDASGYTRFALTHVASNGSFANGDPLILSFVPNGDKGDTGATGATGSTGATGADGVSAGYRFNFDDTTSMADPGTGDIRLNNATLSSVTAAAISDLSAATGNPDVSAAILAWDDSTNTVRGTLVIKKFSAPQNIAVYNITGASTDNSGWTQLALTYVTHAGSFSAADALTIEFARAGDSALNDSNWPLSCGYLSYSSATALLFKPYNGDAIRINGVVKRIPAAGIAGLANTSVFVNGTGGQNLGANTEYLVYAFVNSGTVTADFRTDGNGHGPSTTTGNIGTEVRYSSGTTEDDTRSLIGRIRTNGSSQFADSAAQRFVLSWFNRRHRHGLSNFSANRTTASTSYAEVNSEIRNEFLTWADEVVAVAISGRCNNDTLNQTTSTSIGFDGTTAEDAFMQAQAFAASSTIGLGFTYYKGGLSEGYHYATLLGKVSANTGLWVGGATPGDRVTLNTTIIG